MLVSHTAECALRAVVWLALHPGSPQSAGQIGEATGVSVTYLPKVMLPLSRCGVVTGVRGTGGGYTLDRDPRTLAVLEVVECVDPLRRIERCPLCPPSDPSAKCPLHQMLQNAAAATRDLLARVTLADLLHGHAGLNLQPSLDVSSR